MNKIMFLAFNPTSLAGILHIISNLKAFCQFTPVLVCEGCYYESDDFQVINLEKKGFDKMRLGVQNKNLTTWYNSKQCNLFYQTKVFYKTYKKMQIIDRKAKEIFNTISPTAVIVTDDRVGNMHMALLKQASSTVVIRVPAAIQTDYSKSFNTRFYDKSLVVNNNIFNLNRLQRRISDSLIRTINYESRVFYQTGYALALYALGMLPLHPWVSGASMCDYVFAVSRLEKKRIIEEAKPRVLTVTVTGLPEDYDIVYGCAKKHDIRKKYELLGNSVVVIAIPQIAEHNKVSWEIHRSNISVLCKYLNLKYGKLLLSLHPKSRKEDYAFLQQNGLGHICDEKLSELIHYADIVICSKNSSVREWVNLVGAKQVLIDTDKLLSNIDNGEEVLFEENILDDIQYREKSDIKNISLEISKILNEVSK